VEKSGGVLASMGTSIVLQLLFLYIFISSFLLEFNPWYAVIVYINIALVSLFLGIYSIVLSVRKSSNAIFLMIPIGIVTTLFSVGIIGFTVFAYFLPEGGSPPIIQL
jgi:hypothetical protein